MISAHISCIVIDYYCRAYLNTPVFVVAVLHHYGRRSVSGQYQHQYGYRVPPQADPMIVQQLCAENKA